MALLRKGGAIRLISFEELHMMQMPKIAARQAWWGGALCVIGVLAAATPAAAIQLVTEQEAALPPDRLPGLELRGSPTRRPSAVIVSPPPNAGVMKSPVIFKIKLQAHGGAKIDPDSIVVTYKKTPEIDITQRIMPFITADGIDVPDAEVPPGTHQFRIELKDNEGHLGAADFSFQVGK
jgi:hypothetical protein